MPMTGLYDGKQLHHPVRGKSFDDSESFLSPNKVTGRSRGLPENNLLKSISTDKEKANNVAKIKVVVCVFNTIWKFIYSLPIYHVVDNAL